MSNLPPPPGQGDQPPPPGGGTPPPPPGGGTPPPPPPGGQPPPPGAGTPPPGQPQYTPTAGGYGYTTGTGEMATFGQRLGAWLIDWLICAAMFIPAWLVLVTGPTEITTCIDDEFALCEQPTGGTFAAAAVLGLLALIGALAYFGILEGNRGQTVGKKALNIKTVDANTGEVLGVGRAIGRRLFAYFISSLVCYLGFLWMLWDDQSQTWHDKVTNASVIKV